MINQPEKSFIHPLSSIETINTVDGEKKVMNSWAFASMIWSGVLNGKVSALGIAKDLLTDTQLARFVTLSKKGDVGAARTAIAVMAFALEEKIEEEFESLE